MKDPKTIGEGTAIGLRKDDAELKAMFQQGARAGSSGRHVQEARKAVLRLRDLSRTLSAAGTRRAATASRTR
ncbi:MAG: hypothetical protein PPHEINF_3276 [uncultured Paraburkholderia sp.]|nr:MAG: hypothetical protein PPHEINF_3276 [uncultured Paraburkholderia sp.]